MRVLKWERKSKSSRGRWKKRKILASSEQYINNNKHIQLRQEAPKWSHWFSFAMLSIKLDMYFVLFLVYHFYCCCCRRRRTSFHCGFCGIALIIRFSLEYNYTELYVLGREWSNNNNSGGGGSSSSSIDQPITTSLSVYVQRTWNWI